MARQAAAYLILGGLAATFVQCASDHNRQTQAAIQPVPQTTPAEQAMTPAAGTATAAPTAEAPPPATAEPQPAAAVPEKQTMTDEQIAAMTDAANTAEIDQAKIAQKNAKNQRVKKFAAMMITDHTQAKQKQKPVSYTHLTLPTILRV